MPPFKKLKQQQRVLHTNKPNKPNHFQTTANATVQAPMQSVRHASARSSAALAKIFMSKYTFHSQAAIFLRGKALLFYQEILSLQNIQQSSEHAAFLSQKCCFSFFDSQMQPAFNHTVCLSKYQIPTQHAVCDQHFLLLSKKCNDQCTLKTL